MGGGVGKLSSYMATTWHKFVIRPVWHGLVVHQLCNSSCGCFVDHGSNRDGDMKPDYSDWWFTNYMLQLFITLLCSETVLRKRRWRPYYKSEIKRVWASQRLEKWTTAEQISPVGCSHGLFWSQKQSYIICIFEQRYWQENNKLQNL